MTSRVPLLLLTALILASCGPSASDPNLDDLASLNDSLQRRTPGADSLAHAGHKPIPTMGPSCTEFAARADTVREIYDKLSDHIDQMKFDLVRSDADDLSAGDRVFGQGDAGAELFLAIKEYYAYAERHSADQVSAAEIRRFGTTAFPYATAEAWREHSFTRAPRAAVVTNLSKTRADLSHTESLCIDSMLRKCIGKSSVPASGDIDGRKKDETSPSKPKSGKSPKQQPESED